MKSIFRSTAVTALLVFASYFLNAQDELPSAPKTPRWVSEKGYWIIESNINTPDKSTVYFYNNEHVLIYKERVEGIVLDARKTKIKMRLKRALETSAIAYNKKKEFCENQQWVVRR